MTNNTSLKYTLVFVLFTLIGCQRDDICTQETSTTPRLLVEFFDIVNIETLKSVPRLSVYAEGFDPLESTNLLVNNNNANSVALPLKVGVEGEETTTRFIIERDTNLRLDENAATESNIDILEITYIPEFVFVSRACGFKSLFTNLRVNIISDTDNWALLTNFPDSTTDNIILENEATTHLYIFH